MKPRKLPGAVPVALIGVVLVIASTVSVQGSAALASGLFDRLSPTSVSGLRQGFGAIALLLLVRPSLRGRSRGDWLAIAVLAAAMALMNALYYQAVALLPLGIAATLFYLGPFALAARHTPRGPQLVLPVLALIGVGLVTGINLRGGIGGISGLGLAFGLAAAAALAGYTLASQRLGRSQGIDSLTLAIAGSALLLTPASVPAVGRLVPGDVGVLLLAGSIGVAVTFGCDFYALRLTGVRLVTVLFALDPVMGALIGVVFLSQSISALTGLGIGLVVLSGAAVTALTAGQDRSQLHGRRATGIGLDAEPEP